MEKVRKIKNEDATKLYDLKQKIELLSQIQDALITLAVEVTGESEWTFDFLMNGYPNTVRELAEKIGLEVE